jgi:hypothetical protein
VQRAVVIDEVTAEAAPPGSGGSGGQGASGGSGAGGGAAGGGAGSGSATAGPSDADLDLLARRLYGRIRDRLARELLLDRERSGMLADR